MNYLAESSKIYINNLHDLEKNTCFCNHVLDFKQNIIAEKEELYFYQPINRDICEYISPDNTHFELYVKIIQ